MSVAVGARGLLVAGDERCGGVKQSGVGGEGGHEGLLDHTELKHFAIGGRP